MLRPPALSGPFLGHFDSIRPGERLGFVDGPGQHPAQRAGVVYGKGEGRWGCWVRVKMPDYTFNTVHSLTVVGIGAYLLRTR